MNEPGNHTGWIDRFGDTWVRADDMPGRDGTWWHVGDGPHWATPAVGSARTWDRVVADAGPTFAPADDDRTAEALELVRQFHRRNT